MREAPDGRSRVRVWDSDGRAGRRRAVAASARDRRGRRATMQRVCRPSDGARLRRADGGLPARASSPVAASRGRRSDRLRVRRGLRLELTDLAGDGRRIHVREPAEVAERERAFVVDPAQQLGAGRRDRARRAAGRGAYGRLAREDSAGWRAAAARHRAPVGCVPDPPPRCEPRTRCWTQSKTSPPTGFNPSTNRFSSTTGTLSSCPACKSRLMSFCRMRLYSARRRAFARRRARLP